MAAGNLAAYGRYRQSAIPWSGKNWPYPRLGHSALLVEFQARPSVIPPLWRDDRCAPKSVEQADLEGNHSYKFIYSGFSRTS